tara:strand:- start:2911 stop:3435 length:525 start_codon:yes stop_codon:yes gene_type:complete
LELQKNQLTDDGHIIRNVENQIKWIVLQEKWNTAFNNSILNEKMKIDKLALYPIAIILSAFGLFTLYLSSTVIFDLFGIRSAEGNYVWFVVWANFISSFLYLLASHGLFTTKKWANKPLEISLSLLLLAFLGLIVHIQFNGDYEQKTVYAMLFRSTLTFWFLIYTNKKIKVWKK